LDNAVLFVFTSWAHRGDDRIPSMSFSGQVSRAVRIATSKTVASSSEVDSRTRRERPLLHERAVSEKHRCGFGCCLTSTSRQHLPLIIGGSAQRESIRRTFWSISGGSGRARGELTARELHVRVDL